MKYICALVVWIFSLSVVAQSEKDKIPLTYQSTMIGIGSASLYDTYLSPLEYTGTNFSLLHERLYPTNLLQGKISMQHLFQINIASTENPAQNASEYKGNLHYDFGMFYRFRPVRKFRFFAGLQADGLLGGIYNLRNGNNPTAVQAAVNLNLSGMATYGFFIKKQPVNLRWQCTVPALGVLFSPEYGQSYYELAMDEDADLVHFASLHNQHRIDNIVSVELPFNRFTLKLAYENSYYDTQVNSLDTRIVSNTFFIGFSHLFYNVKGKKLNKEKYRYVLE
jgi:hypothetical protein